MATLSPHPLQVLIVEECEADFLLLARLLEKSTAVDYRLDWAKNLRDGRERMSRGNHDIGLLAFHLGGGSGIDLLREAPRLGRDIPLILLTAQENTEADRQALEAGAADFLCKTGLTVTELERAIRYALHKSSLHSALRKSRQQLELFMRNVPCAVGIRDEDGQLLFQNELFADHFRNGELHRVLQLAPNVKDWPYADHGRHWLVNSFMMVNAEARRLQGFAAINITKRVETEEQLRRANRLLNGILSSLPVIASSVETDGTILESRGHGLEVIGLHEDELVGANFHSAYPEVADNIQKALDGGSANFFWTIPHRGRTYYFDSYFHFDAERGQGAIGFSVNVTARLEAENQRNSQTQLLHSIMKSMPVIVGRLDSSRRVTEAQGDGLAARGITPDGLIGKIFPQLYRQSREAIARAQRNEVANFTLTGRTGGEEEWHVDFSFMRDEERGQGTIFFGRDVTDRRWLERQILTISDAEQQRIGADLHDGLGQQLTGLACLAAALRDRLKSAHPAEAQQAELIATLANEAIVQTRALSRGFCPVQLEQAGLISALEDLAYQSQLLLGASCRFRTRGSPPPLCEHLTAIHLYRIAQEAIHNAVRHGGASQIDVVMVSRDNRHRLIIADNGRGFDTAFGRAAPGGGLRLMNYRATMIGGVFSFTSKPGHGTRVACSFTISPHEKRFRISASPGERTAQTPDFAGR